MVICPNCGAENPDGKRFCGDCGAMTSPRRIQPIQQANPQVYPNWFLWHWRAVVAVVVVVVVLAAMSYSIIRGFDGGIPQIQPAPTASLKMLVNVLISTEFAFDQISRDTPWSDVSVRLSDGLNTASWSPPTSELDQGFIEQWIDGPKVLGILNITCTVTDDSGNGYINEGDSIALHRYGAPFSQATTYTITIIYGPTSSEICHVDFQGNPW